jgi:cellulose synthase (UDP-forming)
VFDMLARTGGHAASKQYTLASMRGDFVTLSSSGEPLPDTEYRTPRVTAPGGRRDPFEAPAGYQKVPPSRVDLMLTRLAIALTLIATVLFLLDSGGVLVDRIAGGKIAGSVEQFVFIGIVAMMVYGAFVYLVARLGYVQRHAEHEPASPEEIDAFLYESTPKPIVFLLPSYKEEERVVWQGLMSAAVQEYPDRRVVLLIDDPPATPGTADGDALDRTRWLVRRLRHLLAIEAARIGAHAHRFESLAGQSEETIDEARTILHQLLTDAAWWFRERIAEIEISDHTDRLFVDQVLEPGVQEFEQAARAVATGPGGSSVELVAPYRKLRCRFEAQVTSFERKQYVSLSNEPNKAMNLNSYIGLIGKQFIEQPAGGAASQHVHDGPTRFEIIPSADYVITLDADSILLPGYAARLVHLMEQPGNEQVAVAQTPYSAVPGASKRVERLAGATTDIMYLMHQGFTRHGATYWVGANAVLRKAALDDICTSDRVNGYEIKTYVQDHTVIEDTESTVDLLAAGWSLHNYPERLAYSATPPDFGSLIVQRGRWANGGLIILPKLIRYLRSTRRTLREGVGSLLQIHYLVSISVVNAGLPLLLFFSFEDGMRTVWLPLAAVPYFALYARDLKMLGYRRSDVVRVYALNLMLIPVHLSGVFKSIVQAVTGRKVAFARTPKVTGRTAAAPYYVLSLYAALVFCAVAVAIDFAAGRYTHAVFTMVNGLFFTYAIVALIGIREGWQDVYAGLQQRMASQSAFQRVEDDPPRRAPARDRDGSGRSEPILGEALRP